MQHARCTAVLLLLLCVISLGLTTGAGRQRVVVHLTDAAAFAEAGLKVGSVWNGYEVLQVWPELLAIVALAPTSTSETLGTAASTERTASSMPSSPAIRLVETDPKRTLQVLPKAKKAKGCGEDAPRPTCKWQDTPNIDDVYTAQIQVVPWGIQAVQALDPYLNSVRTTDNLGVSVCIIDSGYDKSHPDLAKNKVHACNAADGCPFNGYQDDVGHGTHVAGTISARANGKGVLGVIPSGVTIEVVRIFDSEGDTGNSVFSTDTVRAYKECVKRLRVLQKASVRTQRMVVSMSFGGEGANTMEEDYLSNISKAGDILFVAAAGNTGNPGVSYPAGYPSVISVAAIDCNGTVADFSNYNSDVELAGPGVDVLSDLANWQNNVVGSITINKFIAPAEPPSWPTFPPNSAGGGFFGGFLSSPAAAADDAEVSGIVSAAGTDYVEPSVFTEASAAPPKQNPAPRSAAAVGFASPVVSFTDPAPTLFDFGFPPPVSVTGPLVDCGQGRRKQCTYAFGAICLIQRGGGYGVASSMCGKMNACMLAGGIGMLVHNSADAPVCEALDDGSLESCADSLFTIPVLGLTSGQGQELVKMIAAAAQNGESVNVTMEIKYQPMLSTRMSGTSMATPHVSGVAARVWAAYPQCSASDVRNALAASALHLGYGTERNQDTGFGLVQAKAALQALSESKCAQRPPPNKYIGSTKHKPTTSRKASPRRSSGVGGKSSSKPC